MQSFFNIYIYILKKDYIKNIIWTCLQVYFTKWLYFSGLYIYVCVCIQFKTIHFSSLTYSIMGSLMRFENERANTILRWKFFLRNGWQSLNTKTWHIAMEWITALRRTGNNLKNLSEEMNWQENQRRNHCEILGAKAKYGIGKIGFMPLLHGAKPKHRTMYKTFLSDLSNLWKKKKRDQSKFSSVAKKCLNNLATDENLDWSRFYTVDEETLTWFRRSANHRFFVVSFLTRSYWAEF